MSQYGWDNCPDAARSQVIRLVDGFRTIVDGNLAGVCLHGSLALGCFNPLRSDLDLLAVTHAAMDAGVKRRLAQFLLDVSQQPHHLELSFLRRADLHPWRYPTPFDFHYSESWRTAFTEQLAGPAMVAGEPYSSSSWSTISGSSGLSGMASSKCANAANAAGSGATAHAVATDAQCASILPMRRTISARCS